MTSIVELDRQIEEKKRQLETVHGRETEVYTRIVGYYRSLKNWNKGKKEEFKERKTYLIHASLDNAPTVSNLRSVDTTPQKSKTGSALSGVTSYLYFYRDSCPNCPAMKSVIAGLEVEGRPVNVDSEAGFKLATQYEVLSTPHVIFLNVAEQELLRSGDPVQVRSLLAAEALAG